MKANSDGDFVFSINEVVESLSKESIRNIFIHAINEGYLEEMIGDLCEGNIFFDEGLYSTSYCLSSGYTKERASELRRLIIKKTGHLESQEMKTLDEQYRKSCKEVEKLNKENYALKSSIVMKEKVIEGLKAIRTSLEGCLEFYADEDHYHYDYSLDGGDDTPVIVDGGKRAREALGKRRKS